MPAGVSPQAPAGNTAIVPDSFAGGRESAGDAAPSGVSPKAARAPSGQLLLPSTPALAGVSPQAAAG